MSADARPLRVALVTEQLRRPASGGIGRYASSLRQALDRINGVVVDDVHGHLPTEATTRLWQLGLPVRMRADVLHGTSFAMPRTLPQRPMTVFVHDVLWRGAGATTLNARGKAFHERGLREAKDRAGLVFVPSRAVASSLVDAGIAAERIRVTGEGSDHLPVVARKSSEPFLLSVGTFEPRKNLAGLLAAYGVVRSQLPACPPLRLVGSSKWRGAPGLPPALPDGVELLGPVSDDALAALFAEATAFVFPSFAEGYGLPPIEAMRAGVPVISSAVPSLVEDSGSDEQDGLSPVHSRVEIVDPTEPGTIAAGIVRVLKSSERQAELAEAGRRWAAGLTWDRVAARHVEGWRELL